jgi:hypothetical protein
MTADGIAVMAAVVLAASLLSAAAVVLRLERQLRLLQRLAACS